jgi:hypothetical protein
MAKLISVARPRRDEAALEKTISEFGQLLADPDIGENPVQTFLELHSELIPTPFLLNHSLHLLSVVSKLRLTKDLTTDFAYLTKSSASWECCLIEIEDASKRIFTSDLERVVFHSDFNKALGQVESWRCFVEGGGATQIREWLGPLLKVMPNNRLRFKYALVYGRRAEMEGNQERIDRWDQLSSSDRRVLTYDSLISSLRNAHIPLKKSILTMRLKGYTLKKLNGVETPLFAFLRNHELFIDKDTDKELVHMGYKMKSWNEGKLLSVNYKFASGDPNAFTVIRRLRAKKKARLKRK